MDNMTILISIYAVLQLADAATTIYALDHLTGGYEKNPALRWMFEKFGMKVSLVAVKVPVIAVCFLLPDTIFMQGIVLTGIIMYLAVVGNNLKTISELQ